MVGKITIKRAVKRTSNWAAIATQMLGGTVSSPAAVLYYHRVADLQFIDPHFDDHNVSPDNFERHIESLTEFADIVPLIDLPGMLRNRASQSRAIVCLTFDDGYGHFVSN